MSGPVILGKGYYGEKTKDLVKELPNRAIALICHRDIDRVAAESLINKGVKAVINKAPSMSGAFYHEGVKVLLEHHIPVYDLINEADLNQQFQGWGFDVMIKGEDLLVKCNDVWESRGHVFKWDAAKLMRKMNESQERMMSVFHTFMENSLSYAREELPVFFRSIEQLKPVTSLEDKLVFVVARGPGYEKDLKYWWDVLRLPNSQILAVDGAVEGILAVGLKPDYIIGDMDSLPKKVYGMNCEFIAHAYLSGKSPGYENLQQYGVNSEMRQFPGVSEDLALALAYKSGAEHIFTIGCRTGFLELMEKNRPGMGSTILIRIFAGDKLSDLKAGNKLSPASLFAFNKRMRHRLIEEENWGTHGRSEG